MSDLRSNANFMQRGHYTVLSCQQEKQIYFVNLGKWGIEILMPYTFSSNCSIRNSTYRHLRTIHRSEAERLSDRMRISLLRDELYRISPILPEVYLVALDRRLGKVLETVEECISQHGSGNVIFDKLKLPLRRGWFWLLTNWAPKNLKFSLLLPPPPPPPNPKNGSTPLGAVWYGPRNLWMT